MNTPFSVDTLARENRQFRHTAGVSEGCRSRHFVPAFYDAATGRSYPSRFADGRPAPLHLLDGTAGTTPESAPALRHAAGMSDDIPQARGRAEALGGVSGFSDPTQGRGPNRLPRLSHAVRAAQVTE